MPTQNTPRDLGVEDTEAVAKVQKMICPECGGPLVPRHDADDPSIIRAKACPKHGEWTTPKGRGNVRRIRKARGLE